jgi:hypothetical protein
MELLEKSGLRVGEKGGQTGHRESSLNIPPRRMQQGGGKINALDALLCEIFCLKLLDLSAR